MKMLKTKEKIKQWLDKYEIKHYTINANLTVDVIGNVFLDSKQLNQIPVQFNNVTGLFDCSRNRLISLIGSPTQVRHSFYCENNCLTTLEGAPNFVGDIFACCSNQIISLEFCPEVVAGEFFCERNKELGKFQYITDFNIIYKEHKRINSEKEILKLASKFDKIQTKQKQKLKI